MKLIITQRSRKTVSVDPIHLKPPPNKKPFEKQSVLLTILPSLAMAVPMMLGFYFMSRKGNGAGASYMTMGLCTAVGSALIGAIIASANLYKRNEKMRYAERLRKRSYRNYLDYVSKSLSEHINLTENVLRNDFPSFDELVNITSQTITCLYNNSNQVLSIRLGVGDKDYSLPIKADYDYSLTEDVLRCEMSDIISEYSRLKRVPICVDLAEGESLSIIAERISDINAIFMIIIARICLMYPPDSYKVGFRFNDPLYKQNLEILKFMPHLINPDDTDFLAQFRENERLIIFSDHKLNAEDPPASIKIFLGFLGGSKLIHYKETDCFIIDERGNRCSFIPDVLNRICFETIVRCTCRLRDFDNESDFRGIVKCAPILDVLKKSSGRRESDFDCLSDIVRDNWQKDTAIFDLSTPLGFAHGNEIVYLNPHERGDGPHGLIAGMTGSGKSEMLMSLVLTMAYLYPPRYVSFFLIDYKGGGMASCMDKLPHVIGSISNLSGSDIGRAFLSIRSENERRERLFIENGVNNILKYQIKYRDGECDEPLPHIFIIIDEFAQLKLEEPDFMQDMIAMSRVGRSLGIHLILCTQKPSGSVDGQIISNSGFQIALKLQDPMDSKEIIRRVDAAYLSNPGRAILRCGNDERVETFQCSYCLSPALLSKKKTVLMANQYGKALEEEKPSYSADISSLDLIMQAICDVEAECETKLRPLWLKELPNELSVCEMMRFGGDEERGVPIGLWDDAVSVSRGILRIDIDEGNVLIAGMPFSGKSVLIETFLSGFGDTQNIYIFDWGGGRLKKFEKDERVCMYCAEGSEQNAKEELSKLCDMSYGRDIGSVVIIDGIGNLIEQAGYEISTIVRELLRKSEASKIRVMVSCGGIGTKEVNKSMQGYFRQFLALRQQDAYQYSEILSKPHFKGRTDLCPGRGYTYYNGRIAEFMTATVYE